MPSELSVLTPQYSKPSERRRIQIIYFEKNYLFKQLKINF